MSLSTPPNSERLSKRQKIADNAAKRSKSGWRNRNKNTETHTALICRLPLELLAEALSYLLPIDILALARSSKYFCNTLIGTPAIFIWKRARAFFSLGSIPDPPPNWTESALAAFLFDDASCAVCCAFFLVLALALTPFCLFFWRGELPVMRKQGCLLSCVVQQSCFSLL
jgi:hypothetical protein